LFISKATVKVHVGHILEKTGARSRTEIAGRERPKERPQAPE
jgi:DNA-binding NarL/FixJ family response regulator